MKKSRTAKLWLLYLDYISSFKKLLRAERTGDWQLHLDSIRSMINLFAATGHNNYAKCARLYVEFMSDLPDKFPHLHEQFVNGLHVARRSNKFWAGISTDLAIEQAMMRSVKSSGGLTHGRGSAESVRALWTATVHQTGSVRVALAQFADKEYCHDIVQHAELGESRCKRDNDDLNKLVEYLSTFNPFDVTDPRLHCLTSGIAATESDDINCDDAEKVGSDIVNKLNGLKYSEVTMKRKEQVKTLAHVINASSNTTKKQFHSIDPTVLFNRLLVIMQRSNDVQQYFSYELTAMPTALFKDNYMRKADKSQLAKEISKGLESEVLPQCSVNVIDGGYLLRVVKWTDGSTYGEVCRQYLSFIAKQYGQSAVIVFDGYCNGPSTKSHEHKRRASKMAPDIVVEATKVCHRDQ
jgi:hypothetical protein